MQTQTNAVDELIEPKRRPRAPSAGAPKPPLVIKATSGWASIRFRELWSYRELLYFLVWRDVKVKYKQTAIGIAWTVLQPIANVILFTLIFGHLARLPTNGVPYPIFFYAGFLPWQIFAIGLSQSSTSLVSNQALLTKVYFPRVLIPAGVVLAGVVDAAISFVVLLAFYAYYGMTPTFAIFALPIFIVLAFLSALGAGVWLSALNVRYRDVQTALPLLSQIWFFATPIAYAPTLLPASWRALYDLNPMTGVLDGVRWALFRTPVHFPIASLVATAVIALLLGSGLAYFRRVERTFADVV